MSTDKNIPDETLYARWLEGKLTEEEKIRLQENGEELVLKNIITSVDSFVLPDLSEDLYDKVLERRLTKKTKVVRFSPFMLTSMAAVFAVLVVLCYQLFAPVRQEILGGSQLGAIQHSLLPDGNHVHVLANSSLSYADDFLQHKEVDSKGLVYFDIVKKGPFLVHTSIGDVSVKGTRFDVLNTDQYFTVTCYEGLVECTPKKGESYLLRPGKSFSFDKNQNIIDFDSTTNTEPEWLKGTQSFKGESLKSVLATLEVQFGVRFNYSEHLHLNRNFTGKYFLNNRDQALKSVFLPLGINYAVSDQGDKTIVTLQ